MTIQRFQSLRPDKDMPQLQALLGAKRPVNGLSPRGGWYDIQNKSDSSTEVTIYEEIGGFGVTAADFVRDFSAIKSKEITLRVSSPGGSVFDGIPIYNAIGRHPATVTAYIDGLAASAASFIVMAADKVVMSPHSQMMIHEASGLVIGPAGDMRQMADFLDKASDNIAGIYSERAGGTVEDWRALMVAETWFSDQEAVDAGLADSIDGKDTEEAPTPSRPAPAKASVDDFLALINKQMEDAATPAA